MGEQTQPAGNGKTVAILSYITWIGWIIALVLHSSYKTSFGAFHLRQSGLIMILFAVLSLLGRIFSKSPLAALSAFLFGILSVMLLVFIIMGILRAANGDTKPLPYIGDYAQKFLAGLK